MLELIGRGFPGPMGGQGDSLYVDIDQVAKWGRDRVFGYAVDLREQKIGGRAKLLTTTKKGGPTTDE